MESITINVKKTDALFEASIESSTTNLEYFQVAIEALMDFYAEAAGVEVEDLLVLALKNCKSCNRVDSIPTHRQTYNKTKLIDLAEIRNSKS